MKIRCDFVTNSSSSSFILAREEELTERQKQAIVDFVCANLMGKQVLTPDSTEEEIQKFCDKDYSAEERQEEIRQALKDGKSIYYGIFSFEGYDYDYAEMFEKLWKLMEECEPGRFSAIDGDLSY